MLRKRLRQKISMSSSSQIIFLPISSKKEPTPAHLTHLKEPIDTVSSVLPDGRINPECPCLESALAHRCGFLIRDAITCFNNSKSEPRGAECEEEFTRHAMCLIKK
ncbi:unnamed protein product, partial [Mesorhabditis belari]|uniref:CHCH domain-containing protein n=1 Tax=Mesorhabditis belari TaxID=2138241 RepID=A0AAF3F7H0_9BILA